MQNGVRATFVNLTRLHEGVIHFMYADNKGYVTIGIGMKIDKDEERAGYHKPEYWRFKKGVQGVIDAKNIKQLFDEDWNVVKELGRKGLKQGQGGNLEAHTKNACAKGTKLRLTDDGLSKMFEKRLNHNENLLMKSPWFANWNELPGDAQVVLLDLAWWLPGALASGGRYKNVNFRPLCEACKKFDFMAASKEVQRWAAQAHRKHARRQLFTNAAMVRQLNWPTNRVYYPNDLAMVQKLGLI